MRLKRYNRTPVEDLHDIPFFDGPHGVGMYFFKEGDKESDAYYSNKEMFGEQYPVVVEVDDGNITHIPSSLDDYWTIRELMYHDKRTCFRVRSKVGGKYEYIVTDIDSIVIIKTLDTYPMEELSYDEGNKTIRGSKSNICYATIDYGVWRLYNDNYANRVVRHMLLDFFIDSSIVDGRKACEWVNKRIKMIHE